jgi:protein-tyrosine-phosphatase
MRRHVASPSVVVDSFGTLEQGGAPALLPAIRAARVFGIDLRDHRSSVLRQGVLEDADLVIGFEPFHVASAVVVAGAATSRTFLLTELVDALLASTRQGRPAPSGRFESILASADARRRNEPFLSRSLADPVGHPDRRFHALYTEIDRLVGIVASSLFTAGAQQTG